MILAVAADGRLKLVGKMLRFRFEKCMTMNSFMFISTMYKIQLKCRVEEEQKSYNQNRAYIFSNVKQYFLKEIYIYYLFYFLFYSLTVSLCWVCVISEATWICL